MGYSFLPSFLYLSLILYTPCSERSLLCFWCNLSYFYGQIHSVFLKFFLHTLILSCRFYYLHKFLCTLFVQLRSSLCLPLCGCFLLSGLGSAALQNALTSQLVVLQNTDIIASCGIQCTQDQHTWIFSMCCLVCFYIRGATGLCAGHISWGREKFYQGKLLKATAEDKRS